MKNIIVITSLLIFAFSCRAQTTIPEGTVPIENEPAFLDNHEQTPGGTYFKDVNGVLDKYIGTWKGTLNNKNFELIITETTKEYEEYSIKNDLLLMKYKIIDLNGNSLYSTIPLNDDSYLVPSGYKFTDNGEYYMLTYVGEEGECGQKGTIFLESIDNGDQLTLFYTPRGDIILESDCPNGEADQLFPVEEILTLDKQ